MNENSFLKKLHDFTNTIIEFENLLIQVFSLTDSPYNVVNSAFPRKGEVLMNNKIISYHFHGGGCSFTFNDILYEYEIQSTNLHCIKISPWKYSQYLNSVSDRKYSEIEIIEELSKLEQSRVLVRLPLGKNFFQINIAALHLPRTN